MAILDSGFLQIPHWPPPGPIPEVPSSLRCSWGFLRAPLPSPTCSLLPRAMTGLSPASRLPCRSHDYPPSLRSPWRAAIEGQLHIDNEKIAQTFKDRQPYLVFVTQEVTHAAIEVGHIQRMIGIAAHRLVTGPLHPHVL